MTNAANFNDYSGDGVFGRDRHSTPLTGGGFASRMTPGYAHVGWETLVRAVEVLEQPVSSIESNFGLDSGRIPADSQETRKAG